MTKLDDFLSSYSLCTPEPWDNTGFLINTNSSSDHILLAIDVTDKVIHECIHKKISFIFSYHPIIFNKLNKIDGKYIELIKNNISVYSIHTALDLKICTFLCNELKGIPTKTENTYLIARNSKKIKEVLKICKKLANLNVMRYVLAEGHSFDYIPEEIVIGVGAAQDAFKTNLCNSLIITGEMRHHDMLYYKYNGVSVVLMEHSNSERLFLPRLKSDMEEFGLHVEISENDRDPVDFYL